MDPLPLERRKISFRGTFKARGHFVNFTVPKVVQEEVDVGEVKNSKGETSGIEQEYVSRVENVDTSGLAANSNESASEVFYFAAQGDTEEKGYAVCRSFRQEIDWLVQTGDAFVKRRANDPEIMMLYSESGELIRAKDLSRGMTLKVIIQARCNDAPWMLVNGPDCEKVPYAWVRFGDAEPEPFELYIKGVGEGVGFYN